MAHQLDLLSMLNLPFSNQDFANQLFRTLGYIYEALKGDKYYVTFETDIGAGLHCEAGSASYFEQQVFDWLESNLRPQKSNYHLKFGECHV